MQNRMTKLTTQRIEYLINKNTDKLMDCAWDTIIHVMLNYFNYRNFKKYNTACFYEWHIFIKTPYYIFFYWGNFFYCFNISCMYFNIFKNVNNEIYLCVSFNIIEIWGAGKK